MEFKELCCGQQWLSLYPLYEVQVTFFLGADVSGIDGLSWACIFSVLLPLKLFNNIARCLVCSVTLVKGKDFVPPPPPDSRKAPFWDHWCVALLAYSWWQHWLHRASLACTAVVGAACRACGEAVPRYGPGECGDSPRVSEHWSLAPVAVTGRSARPTSSSYDWTNGFLNLY